AEWSVKSSALRAASGDGSECMAATSVSQATAEDVQRTRKLVKAAARKLQEMPVNPILQSVLSEVMRANAAAVENAGARERHGKGVCRENDVLWCDPLFLLHAQSYGM
ncbi:unnamed protein product, partial [Closterium sp. NIES-64]